MINKGSYMYMYLFLLHKNNIRSIHVILNPTDLRQGITMAGSTFWSIGWVMMTLICTLCQWQWCNRSCADLECEGLGGGSLLHSLHSKVTKNRHGTFLIPTLGIQSLIFIFRTPSGILLDPCMIFMDLASVWDEAWLSLPELWMFLSRIPDSWDFRKVRRFESSWWAVNSVWLYFLKIDTMQNKKRLILNFCMFWIWKSLILSLKFFT